jgi:hypothetical protein
MANVAIQVYLTAAVMNLKRLAALSWLIFALLAPLRALRDARRRLAGETLALADQSALTKTLFARAAA